MNLLKYIWRKRKFIAVISILVTLIYYGINCFYIFFSETGTISFIYPSSENGRYPDGTRFNIYDLMSEQVLQGTVDIYNERTGYQPITLEDIENAIEIDEILPYGIHTKVQEARNSGQDYSYFANEYRVTVAPISGVYQRDFHNLFGIVPDIDNKFLIESLYKSYTDYFMNSHAEMNIIPRITQNMTYEGYDYVEIADVFETRINMYITYLESKLRENGSYSSEKTGKSFNDLIAEFRNLNEIKVQNLKSFVSSSKLAKNPTEFINKLRIQNESYNLYYSKLADEAEAAKTAMNEYDHTYEENIVITGQNAEVGLYQARPKTAYDTITKRALDVGVSAQAVLKDIEENDRLINEYMNTSMSAETQARLSSVADRLVEEIEIEAGRLVTLADDTISDYLDTRCSDYVRFSASEKSYFSISLLLKMLLVFLLSVICAILYLYLFDQEKKPGVQEITEALGIKMSKKRVLIDMLIKLENSLIIRREKRVKKALKKKGKIEAENQVVQPENELKENPKGYIETFFESQERKRHDKKRKALEKEEAKRAKKKKKKDKNNVVYDIEINDTDAFDLNDVIQHELSENNSLNNSVEGSEIEAQPATVINSFISSEVDNILAESEDILGEIIREESIEDQIIEDDIDSDIASEEAIGKEVISEEIAEEKVTEADEIIVQPEEIIELLSSEPIEKILNKSEEIAESAFEESDSEANIEIAEEIGADEMANEIAAGIDMENIDTESESDIEVAVEDNLEESKNVLDEFAFFGGSTASEDTEVGESNSDTIEIEDTDDFYNSIYDQLYDDYFPMDYDEEEEIAEDIEEAIENSAESEIDAETMETVQETADAIEGEALQIGDEEYNIYDHIYDNYYPENEEDVAEEALEVAETTEETYNMFEGFGVSEEPENEVAEEVVETVEELTEEAAPQVGDEEYNIYDHIYDNYYPENEEDVAEEALEVAETTEETYNMFEGFGVSEEPENEVAEEVVETVEEPTEEAASQVGDEEYNIYDHIYDDYYPENEEIVEEVVEPVEDSTEAVDFNMFGFGVTTEPVNRVAQETVETTVEESEKTTEEETAQIGDEGYNIYDHIYDDYFPMGEEEAIGLIKEVTEKFVKGAIKEYAEAETIDDVSDISGIIDSATEIRTEADAVSEISENKSIFESFGIVESPVTKESVDIYTKESRDIEINELMFNDISEKPATTVAEIKGQEPSELLFSEPKAIGEKELDSDNVIEGFGIISDGMRDKLDEILSSQTSVIDELLNGNAGENLFDGEDSEKSGNQH